MSAMVDTDQQAALELFKKLNGYPRRESAIISPLLREVLPRKAKRTRTTAIDVEVPMDPCTILSTPQEEANLDRSTSLLISPPISNHFSQVEYLSKHLPKPIIEQSSTLISGQDKLNVESMDYQRDTPTPKACHKKAPQGITEITISEGDRRSQPAPGLELFQMVEYAKIRGEVPKICNSSVVRRIDDKWMAPQMCNSCQDDSKSHCDRQSPCLPCINNRTTCEVDGFMAKLRSAAPKISGFEGREVSYGMTHGAAHDGRHLMHESVGQNSDGSWFCTTQVLKHESILSPEKSSYNFRSTSRVKQHDFGRSDIEGDQEETTKSDPELPQLQKSLSRKRRSEDDEFFPGPEPNDNLHSISSPDKAAKRPRGMAKGRVRKAGKSTTHYHTNVQENKPEPYGQPNIWGDKRQPLCETLPYYKAYQSGAYMTDGILYGFLIDAEVDIRDKFDEEIVICSVGGGRSADENGKMSRTKDQFKSTTAAAFMRTKERKFPVALIAGQGNRISPSKLPHYYNVLDWFHITDVWCERDQNGYAFWKARLEKINLAEKSWWAAKLSPSVLSASYEVNSDLQDVKQGKVASQTCSLCNQTSKLIYNEGWVCSNTECQAFFHFENGYNHATLDYTDTFLKERTKFPGIDPGPLAPPLLTDKDMASMDAFGIEKEFKRGIVCPKCGCCSRRILWDHWFCESPTCDFTYRITQRPMPISEVIARSMRVGLDASKDLVAGGIRTSQLIKGLYDVNQYSILGEAREVIGFVRHFKSNGTINQQKDGPNDLFLQMQGSDFGLRRNASRLKGSTGEILTSHWAANWGAPYKYGVSQITKGFQQAPVVILKALKRLTWAGEQAAAENLEVFHPFNECLSIGYYEDTKIGYHDDGEKELGPTVATLSLGASATMCFRPKARSSIGNILGKANIKGTKPDVLRITLEHGDIMIMHGRKIQQFYEHAVTPHGKLRFALTCRYIRPEMIDDDQERQDAIAKGALPLECDDYNYDGDIDAVPMVSADRSATDVEKLVNDIAAKVKTGELTILQAHAISEKLTSILKASASESEAATERSEDRGMPNIVY